MAGLSLSNLQPWRTTPTNPSYQSQLQASPFSKAGTQNQPPQSITDAAGNPWMWSPTATGGQWNQMQPAWQSFLNQYMGMLGGGQSGAYGGGALLPSPSLPGQVGAPTVKAVAPSQSAAFGRAKDAASQVYGKAMEQLKDSMTAAGISGSGIEGRLMGGLVSDAARYISGAELKQQLEAQKQAWEAAKGAYEGGISQRGQDITGLTNIYDIAQGAATSQHNALLNRDNPMQTVLMSILQGLMPRY